MSDFIKYASPGLVGIVGHEAAKFTRRGEADARDIIRQILSRPGVTGVVSGGCHLSGVDIWAEEIGRELGFEPIVHKPKVRSWEYGYKPRNILIARDSAEVFSIVVARLADSYRGMRFPLCYHCKTTDHVKSGGCWTAKFAQSLGKPAMWVTIANEE